MTMIIILLSAFMNLFAPGNRSAVIFEQEGINYYEPLMRAVTNVESMNGVYVWNQNENAVGWFQIRQIRVDHYNQLTKSTYKLTDFYDYDLSRDMFLYYARGKSYERAAKDWNGSGPMVVEYWKKVRRYL
jgi:hypothetical protein